MRRVYSYPVSIFAKHEGPSDNHVKLVKSEEIGIIGDKEVGDLWIFDMFLEITIRSKEEKCYIAKK